MLPLSFNGVFNEAIENFHTIDILWIAQLQADIGAYQIKLLLGVRQYQFDGIAVEFFEGLFVRLPILTHRGK
ncbi:hypothetical protein D9M71_618030 [compost metagenome]